jgi:hypothetical protein
LESFAIHFSSGGICFVAIQDWRTLQQPRAGKFVNYMKKVIVIFSLLLAGISTLGQGTIFFNNRTSLGDVPISLPDGSGFGSYPGGASAQLYLVQRGGGPLVPLFPATTFRTSTPAATYFVNPVDVSVSNLPAGTPVTVVMRVWNTSAGSYDAAIAGFGIAGESQPLAIAALGGVNPQTGAIVPTPDLSGLQFNIPEPSTVALGLLGAAALLFRRRNSVA